VDHRLEVLVAHLVDGLVDRVARVVDDDVDLPERVDRLLDELVGGAGLRQVAGVDGGLAADLARGLLGDVTVEVVDQDLRSLGDEQLRGRAADASRRPRDDRRLPVEYSHGSCVSLSVESAEVIRAPKPGPSRPCRPAWSDGRPAVRPTRSAG